MMIDKNSPWRDFQNDVLITSLTIGRIGGIDAPLLGRQCIDPYAGNCSLARDIKNSVSRIILVIELILKSIGPVRQLFDAPLQDLVKRRW
jgi:hypothetical protein